MAAKTFPEDHLQKPILTVGVANLNHEQPWIRSELGLFIYQRPWIILSNLSLSVSGLVRIWVHYE